MNGKLVKACCLAALSAVLVLAPDRHGARAENDPWSDIRSAIFQNRDIKSDDGIVVLYAPRQAEDAATVPIDIRLPAATANTVRTLTLIIDRNPAPVAATLRLGDGFKAGADFGERKVLTRVRVDSFSNVRVIAETADGALHMSAKFVMGAGGCSAPASKDMEEAMANLGKIQIKVLKEAALGANWRESVIMVRHPNFTGMQMDPESRGYTPAMFVKHVEITRPGGLVLSMDGGISISENPNIRFNYDGAGDDTLDVVASDTNGGVFRARSTPNGS